MRRIAAVMLACGFSVGMAATASAADATIVAGLVRNAWYWQARSRPEKAEQVWRSVLVADPDQPDALAAVGGVDARAGRVQQARKALERLRKVAPAHPDAAVLQREIELGPRYGAMLGGARKLVHQGRVEEGIARYREIFGGAGPPGDLALEYFDTLGGTTAGWAEARAGLQRLVDRAPAETRFRLALAKLLTYRDRTRTQGISMLAELSRDPTISKEATTSWRQALLWLGGSPPDVPLLEAYVRAHPGDAVVTRTLEKARRSGDVAQGFAALDRGDDAEAARHFARAGDAAEARRGRAIVRQREAEAKRKAGFAALERGDTATAQRSFQESGDDGAARIGLALVAQREAAEAQRAGDYGRAHALLDRARELAPQRSDIWQPGLQSVEFWTEVDEARAAQRQHDDDLAERKLRGALDRAPPQERWNAELALADVLLDRGDHDGAGAMYRRVLDEVPGQPDALRGVAALHVQAGEFDAAIPVNDELFKVAPDKAFRPGWLRAEAARSRGAKSRAAHDLARARAELEAARRDDPKNVWVLHDLANVLLEEGDTAAAQPVVAALLEAAPGMPQAQIVQGRLLAARGDDARALAVLLAVPERSRDRAIGDLVRRLEVRVRVPAIVEKARGPARAAAIDELLVLERRVQDEPLLAGAVAVAWVKIGDPGRAVALIRHATATSPDSTRTLRLELASTLLQAGDDGRATTVISGLEHDPRLTPHEKRWLADLRISQAVRAADARRAAGDLASASVALDPVLRDYPDDPRVLDAQGRLLERGDAGAAHATYLRVLGTDPDDVDARRGAFDTAVAMGKSGEAQALAADGVRRAPRDPRMHLLAARAEALSGDDPAAMRSLRRAQELAAAPAAPAATGTPAKDGSGAALPATTEGSPPLARESETQAEIGREMERIEERHRSGLGATGEFRVRRGEGGLSALTEFGQSAAAEIAIGYAGRATIDATEVSLDAGTVASSASGRFGSTGGVPGALRARGTALSLGYEGRDVLVKAGTSPLGFPVQTFLGSARLSHAFGPVRLGVEGARRSVTDSMLSYAGVRDPSTGTVWGGVVSQGARADLELRFSRSRYYAYGTYDWLVGQGVADNRRTTAGIGVEATLSQSRRSAVTIGVDAFGMQYDANLRYFTLGQGGYFSPQRFVRGSIPIAWRHQGPLRWEIVAAPGVEWFQEAQSPVFPAVAGAALPQDLPDVPAYPGQVVRGFALDGHALVGWSFARGFELRATTAVQAAPEYQEIQAALMLRYGSDR